MNNKIKKSAAFLLPLLVWVVLGAGVVLGQGGPGPEGPTGPSGPGVDGPTGDPTLSFSLPNPFRIEGGLFAILEAVIDDILLPIGGILAVLAFIYSGFKYVTAQGDTTKIKDAHKALLYTAIGTAVLLGSWMIANVIGNTIDQLRPN